jgi:hypothetical protein
MTFFLLSGENPDNQAKGHCWKPDFGQLIQGDSGQFRHQSASPQVDIAGFV